MINCTELETLLVDFLDGNLAAPTLASVEEHLSQCAACTAEMASYKEIQSAYRNLPEEDVSEAVISEILGAAADRESANSSIEMPPVTESKQVNRFQKRNAFLAMAASVLAVAFLAWNGKRGGPDFDSFVRQGQLHREANEWAPAIEDLSNALDLDGANPQAAEVMLLIAELHLRAGDAKAALGTLNTLSARHPEQSKQSEVYLLRGDVYRELGQHEMAKQIYQEGLEAHPGSADEFKSRVGQPNLEGLKSMGYLGYID